MFIEYIPFSLKLYDIKGGVWCKIKRMKGELLEKYITIIKVYLMMWKSTFKIGCLEAKIKCISEIIYNHL